MDDFDDFDNEDMDETTSATSGVGGGDTTGDEADEIDEEIAQDDAWVVISAFFDEKVGQSFPCLSLASHACSSYQMGHSLP